MKPETQGIFILAGCILIYVLGILEGKRSARTEKHSNKR